MVGVGGGGRNIRMRWEENTVAENYNFGHKVFVDYNYFMIWSMKIFKMNN